MVKFVTVPECLCFWWMCFRVQKVTEKEQMEFRSCHSLSTVGWAVGAWKPWCSYHLCVGNPCMMRTAPANETWVHPMKDFSVTLAAGGCTHASAASISHFVLMASSIALVKRGWARCLHRGQLFFGCIMPLPKAEEGFIRCHLMIFNVPIPLCFMLKEVSS